MRGQVAFLDSCEREWLSRFVESAGEEATEFEFGVSIMSESVCAGDE